MFKRFKRKKIATTDLSAPQSGPAGAEEVADDAEATDNDKLPPTMLDRWARDDAIGGAFTIIKKDGRRIRP